MSKTAWAAIVFVWSLWGCASDRIPFQAAWYMTDDVMYLAVLNQTTEEKEIGGVFLNRTKDIPGSGWKLDKDLPRALEPGQIFVRRIDDFVDSGGNPFGKCRVPVDVVIATKPKDVRAQMKIAMPSAVPEWWSECPKPK